MLPNILAAMLPTIIKDVVPRVMIDPLESHKPQAAAAEVATQVIDQIQRIPEVQQATNRETHWYQQRSKWSAIVTGSSL